MQSSPDEIVRLYPALEPYARKTFHGANDRRAKSFRQAWDFATEHGGILQTVYDVAARRIIAARQGRQDDPSLLPQHTRTLALHYKSGEHWFIAFNDDPTHENLAYGMSHTYGSPSQYAAGWAIPLDGRIYGVLEKAHENGRILPHPSYDHPISGTYLKSTLGEGQDRFEELALSTALLGDLLGPFAEANISLGREAIHYHLPRTADLDEQVGESKVLIVPIVFGGAHAVSPVIHLEKSVALREGVDTYLASTKP